MACDLHKKPVYRLLGRTKAETAYCKRRNPGGMQAEIGVHQPISLGDLWIKARKDSAAG